MQSKNILAGPYELTHKKLAGDRISLCLFDNNVLQTKKYEGGKLVNQKQKACKDFETAISTIEEMIEMYGVDYHVKEDPRAALAGS